MKFETYRPALLPAVVKFWNDSFRQKRNFWPVTPRLFRERVITSPDFDPDGFIVARRGRQVVGLIHVGERAGVSLNGRRSRQGYVALFYVAPEERRKGVGNTLWHLGLDRLRRSHQVLLGFSFNPFYGTAWGPSPPFWGSPFGIGVEWRDGASQKFFARKGFAPRQKAVQMSLDVAEAPWADPEAVRATFRRLGLDLETAARTWIDLGKPLPRPAKVGESVAALSKGRVVAFQSYYPMQVVRPGLYYLNSAVVQGGFERKPVWKPLLRAAVDRMRALGAKSCEVLLFPETSEESYRLYVEAGFVRAAEWAVY